MMKMAFKRISIALLLAAGVASAFANPDAREERAVRQQQRAAQAGQRNAQRGAFEQQRQEERRREAAPVQQNNAPNATPNQVRKPGKLTPEERRALRQQINEAGQDIYAPKH